MMDTLCFATNNRHKLNEVSKILQGKFKIVGLEELGHFDDLAEDFLTLEENARQKAEFVFGKYNVSCFADDTGLEVKALNGEPGVLSARYAGPQKNSTDNIALVLKNLSGKSNRKAQFRTVIALAMSEQSTHYFEGKVVGEIIDVPRGSQGFGYDPVFVPQGFNKTLAEMTIEEKNVISHRARAIEKLVAFLVR
jgi:XTP/dITP diphosphohydrolase